MHIRKLVVSVSLTVVACMAPALKGAAQDDGWPTKQTLRVVVPYAAGSNGDAVGRIIAS
jgi:tripartite-type tricarboxylate transporter receptor subunit TctC